LAVVGQVISDTVEGLGFEFVEVEFAARGMLRVFIDHPYVAGAAEKLISIEDCEAVSRQLVHVLTVEEIDYSRLEVSSPGLDRPLRHAQDFERFKGLGVSIKLKQPFGGRRNFEGLLNVTQVDGQAVYSIEWDERPVVSKGRVKKAVAKVQAAKVEAAKVEAAKKSVKPVPSAGPDTFKQMVFSLDEVEKARLVEIVDFKGRK
jgi:ribosome maturation factor RimP